MKTIIIIPSRMASKRFPGKPMIELSGVPMIQRVWEKAVASKIGEVYVACSEKEVFDLIKKIGGKPILTDPNLPSGTDRIHSAFNQIQKSESIEYIINLQGDMPLIKPSDISKVVEPLKNNFSIGTLATDLQGNEFINPNVTKVKIEWKDKNIGEAKEFFRLKDAKDKNIYHHVGIYSYSINSLLKFVDLPKSENETSLNLEQYRAMDNGISIGVTYSSDIPLSIDTKEDLIDAENIIKMNNESN